jgi:dCMP deaminase
MGPNISKWDERFLRLVDEITSWSKDPSTKCGALIVRPDRSIVSYGFNGFPAEIGDKPMRLNHRPTKYELTVHAETNALLYARESVEGYTMYVNTVPCCRCAVNLIQAKIARVVCRPPTEDYQRLRKGAGIIERPWRESIKKAAALFKEGRVLCYWE